MKDDFKPPKINGGNLLEPVPAFVPVRAEPMPQPASHETGHHSSSSSTNHSQRLPEAGQKPTSHHTDPKRPKGKDPRKWATYYWHKFQGLSKNQKIIITSVLAGLLLVLGSIFWFYVLRAEPAPPPPPPVVKEEPPAPTIYRSGLTGIKVTKAQSLLPTTGIMIENSPDARPQSGLYNAGVVFEAIAEGGITRFLALYQESKPEYIGPVRSVRPYYLDFLRPFDAPIAHAGGSGQALAELRSGGFKDLDAFQNPGHFRRVSNRYAPHNLYTGRSTLLKLQRSKGWSKSKFTGFVRKAEEKAKKPTARKIDLNISSYLYNVHYDYDAKSNSYKRVMGGKAHIDEKAKKQIHPKVVVALVMKHRYAGIYSVYGVKGSGTAYFFQDGKVTKGIWEKKNRKSQFKFGNKHGSPLGLNPGQTWVTIVSSPGAVTYKP